MDSMKILGVILLIPVASIAFAVGVITTFSTTDSLSSGFADDRVATTTQLANVTFSSIRENWENASSGDNNSLVWDNWAGSDNAVWDNVGDTEGGTAVWTRWYQSVTIPTTYSGVTSATITGAYLLSDNTDAENLNLYVYLERPGGDNVTILELENTTALWTADNDTWTTLENTVTTSINAGGTYTLFLQDNVHRLPSAAGENYVGFVWDNWNISVITYDAGYLENIVGTIEEQTGTGYDIGSLVPMIVGALGLLVVFLYGAFKLLPRSKKRTSFS